jgi:hypothetical protein
MLERIGSVDRIDAFLEGVKAKKEKMFGFGHRWGSLDRILCSTSYRQVSVQV